MLAYFALLVALSVPIWIVGGVTRAQIVPGSPVGALDAFCPVIAASILTYRELGSSGVKQLLARSVDYRRIDRKIWYIPILALAPAIMGLSYVVMRAMGCHFPRHGFRCSRQRACSPRSSSPC